MYGVLCQAFFKPPVSSYQEKIGYITSDANPMLLPQSGVVFYFGIITLILSPSACASFSLLDISIAPSFNRGLPSHICNTKGVYLINVYWAECSMVISVLVFIVIGQFE